MLRAAVREDVGAFLSVFDTPSYLTLQLKELKRQHRKRIAIQDNTTTHTQHNMKGLYEILTEKKWMISPDFVHGIRKALEQNLNAHAAFSRPEKQCGYVKATTPDGSIYYPDEYQISEDGTAVKGNWALDYADEQTFPFVSVLTVDGPITRNGGGCSYGSMQHRDIMMRAADHPLCRGHIFIINTPGGSAWAKNDYQQAIEYAHSKGQPVIAFIDGMCASAGMYLAALCDERYYMHPKNEIGCIGVMAAFYTEADGGKNEYSGETYHELYDPESFDKNKSFRDIANDGNAEMLVNELAELGVQFRADVKEHCPQAIDEHLHGKVFNAEDVKGVLMDDQSTFMQCVQRAFALHDGTAQPIERGAAPVNKPEPQPEPQHEDEPKEEKHINSHINMENYPLINAACGLQAGEIVVTEEGVFMNAELLNALEANINVSEQKVADAEQKATDAENALAELQGKFDALNSQLAEMTEARAVAEKALADAQEVHGKEIETMQTSITEMEVSLKGAQDALATAEQTIADKDAQIMALTDEAGNEPVAGEAPLNNGEGVKAQALRQFDPSQYKTNAERKAAFEAYKRGE